ncbi:uncharacterized protein CLUP02_12413 [Colletotrichum lupini]|uniref:Uncharacterized protein n=1 Tax=Colletotrichum lupini TaxID=145971 RepID=A0A9Q8T0F6_9PEZI|nr:uncharacterized protein CLUP02_12413 [Colletotrichum lupini]UQC86911.1 hypothetical protein CLUP02_12413 [Colletotrichum lupini]
MTKCGYSASSAGALASDEESDLSGPCRLLPFSGSSWPVGLPSGWYVGCNYTFTLQPAAPRTVAQTSNNSNQLKSQSSSFRLFATPASHEGQTLSSRPAAGNHQLKSRLFQ